MTPIPFPKLICAILSVAFLAGCKPENLPGNEENLFVTGHCKMTFFGQPIDEGAYQYDDLGRYTGIGDNRRFDYSPGIVREYSGTTVIAVYELDGSGKVVKKTDSHDEVTHYSYDEFGRLVKVFEPNAPSAYRQRIFTWQDYDVVRAQRIEIVMPENDTIILDDDSWTYREELNHLDFDFGNWAPYTIYTPKSKHLPATRNTAQIDYQFDGMGRPAAVYYLSNNGSEMDSHTCLYECD